MARRWFPTRSTRIARSKRKDDRSGQEHDGEQSRPTEAGPHQRVMKRLRIIVEPNPLRRLVRQELEVREAQPQNAEDRPDLIADEEYEGWDEEQPLGHALPKNRDGTAGNPCAKFNFVVYNRLRHSPNPAHPTALCAAGCDAAALRRRAPSDQPFLISACTASITFVIATFGIGLFALEVSLPNRFADDELLQPKNVVVDGLRACPTASGRARRRAASNPACSRSIPRRSSYRAEAGRDGRLACQRSNPSRSADRRSAP